MSLQKGLVGHWTMDEDDTSGGTLYDRSAYDNHGNLKNSPTTDISAIVGEGYNFNSSNNEWIDTGFSPFTNSDFSVSYWIKAPAQENGPAFSTWESGFVGFQSGMGDRWSNSLNDRINFGMRYSNGNANNLNTDDAFDDGNWHHVVVTYDDSVSGTDGMNIWVDSLDVPTSVERSQGDGTVPNNPFYIGYNASDIYYLDGDLDDMRVYDRVLSESEISALYNMRSQRYHNTGLLWKDYLLKNRDSFYEKVYQVNRQTDTDAGWIWSTSNWESQSYDSDDDLTTHTDQGNLSSSDKVSVKSGYLGTLDNGAVGVNIYDESRDRWYSGLITNDHSFNGIGYRDRGKKPNLIQSGNNYDVTKEHTFELQYDDGQLRFYVDGELSAKVSETLTPNGFGFTSDALNPDSYWDYIEVSEIF